MELKKDKTKEKATKARIPVKETAGMSNHFVENPTKLKPRIENPGTIKVTI